MKNSIKWTAISGGWRTSNPKLEDDVRKNVAKVMSKNEGIVSGGALGVDYIATDEALKFDPKAKRIKIFLPVTLTQYKAHYKKRAEEGAITAEQAESLVSQLSSIKKVNPNAIHENTENTEVNKDTYFSRNTEIMNASDELIAFHVNNTEGTKDTINKFRKQGKAVKVLTYSI